MSHAHEAAVAEARQAWRLEFWRRVAADRYVRLETAIANIVGKPLPDWSKEMRRQIAEDCLRNYLSSSDCNIRTADVAALRLFARQAQADLEKLHHPDFHLALIA